MQNIGIIGFGWLASRFAKIYAEKYQIFPTTTSPQKLSRLRNEGYEATLINFERSSSHISQWETITELDAVIISVPLSVRFDSITNVNQKIESIIKFVGDFRGQIILISSTGIYSQELGIYHENDVDPSIVVTEKDFVEKFPQTTILRCGGLMGDDRYISKYHITKDLDQTVNYIHFADVSKVIDRVLVENIASEVLNIVAPNHPTKRQVLEFEKHKTIIQEPNPKERIVSSEKLLLKYGYEFEFPNPLYFKNA